MRSAIFSGLFFCNFLFTWKAFAQINLQLFCNTPFKLILMSVLNCFYDAMNQILRKNLEKRHFLDNLDIAMLALDEICDGG